MVGFLTGLILIARIIKLGQLRSAELQPLKSVVNSIVSIALVTSAGSRKLRGPQLDNEPDQIGKTSEDGTPPIALAARWGFLLPLGEEPPEGKI